MGNMLVVYGVHTEESDFAIKVKDTYLREYGNHRNVHFHKVKGISQESHFPNPAYQEISMVANKIKPQIIIDLHHSWGYKTTKMSLDRSLEIDFIDSEVHPDEKFSRLLESLPFVRQPIYYKPAHPPFKGILYSHPKTVYLVIEAILSGFRRRYYNNSWNNNVRISLAETIERIRPLVQ